MCFKQSLIMCTIFKDFLLKNENVIVQPECGTVWSNGPDFSEYEL